MGQTPTSVNQAANTINTAISQSLSAGCQAVEAMAIDAQPWLGYWFIKPIFEYILEQIDIPISQALQQGATFAVIDIQTGMEENAMSAALSEIQKAEKDNNPTELANAEKDYENAQSNLIHSDGSANPQ